MRKEGVYREGIGGVVKKQSLPPAVATAMAAVAAAAEAFEGRWTMRALARVDRGLHDLFAEQEADYGKALVTGTEAEVEEQAAAMVRGYVAIAKRMADSGEADDAYMLGIDPSTGFRVAIAEQRHAASRVRELAGGDGQEVMVLTPDEVAAIVGGLQVLGKVKAVWPDAEVIRFRQQEAPDAAE